MKRLLRNAAGVNLAKIAGVLRQIGFFKGIVLLALKKI